MTKIHRKFWRKLVAVMIVWATTNSYSYTASTASTTLAIAVPAPNAVAPETIGIAAFRRGSLGLIVFAARLKIDKAALRLQAGFAQAEVMVLPAATVLAVPIKKNQALVVKAHIASWSVVIMPRPQVFKTIGPLVGAAKTSFPLSNPGPSFVILDPSSGGPLLVGTTTSVTASRTRLRGIGYMALPAWRGVVIQPLEDEFMMKSSQQGFILRNADYKPSLPLNEGPVRPGTLVAVRMEGGLGIPNGSVPALRHRLLRDQISLAAAPPLNKLPASLRLAKVLLALGMGPEAHGVLENALRDDPASEGNILRKRLTAVASVLSGQPAEFLRQAPEDVGHSKEMQFWHAVAIAQKERIMQAAKLLSKNYMTLFSYASPLKFYLAPLVAETLAQGGQVNAAAVVMHALSSQIDLRLAHAEMLEAMNHPRAALAVYENLRLSRNLRSSGIAATRITILRYSLHQIGAKQAAVQLSRNLYAWRGLHTELSVRLALARLRAKAGDWAQALHGLQHAMMVLPQGAKELQSERQRLFASLIASGALSKVGPLEAVTTIQENEDLIPGGADGVPTLHILARSLLSLDLPGIAAPVLKNLLARTADQSSRARLELALGGVDLQSGNLKGAETAIEQNQQVNLPSSLNNKRNLLITEINAQGGHIKKTLEPIDEANNTSAASLAIRMEFAAHNWKAAESTLKARVKNLYPQGSDLSSSNADLVAQLATAAFNAGDVPELAALRARFGPYMPHGKNRDLFNAFTVPPIRSNTKLSTALKQIASIERLGAAIPASAPGSSGSR